MIGARHYPAGEIRCDGRPVVIRGIRPADKQAMLDALLELGSGSIHRDEAAHGGPDAARAGLNTRAPAGQTVGCRLATASLRERPGNQHDGKILHRTSRGGRTVERPGALPHNAGSMRGQEDDDRTTG